MALQPITEAQWRHAPQDEAGLKRSSLRHKCGAPLTFEVHTNPYNTALAPYYECKLCGFYVIVNRSWNPIIAEHIFVEMADQEENYRLVWRQSGRVAYSTLEPVQKSKEEEVNDLNQKIAELMKVPVPPNPYGPATPYNHPPTLPPPPPRPPAHPYKSVVKKRP